MAQDREDRMVATLLGIGGIAAALFFIGLFTDWYGLSGAERAPDMQQVQPTP